MTNIVMSDSATPEAKVIAEEIRERLIDLQIALKDRVDPPEEV